MPLLTHDKSIAKIPNHPNQIIYLNNKYVCPQYKPWPTARGIDAGQKEETDDIWATRLLPVYILFAHISWLEPVHLALFSISRISVKDSWLAMGDTYALSIYAIWLDFNAQWLIILQNN